MGKDPLSRPEELLPRVYAYVAYRVSDPAEAEDITSETFERAVRYRENFDERKGEPLGWVLGIARNCVYDAMLRPRPETVAQEAPPAEDTADLEADVVSRLTLQKALATLSPNDRELIALRYGSDLTAREIGRLLNMRTNAVEVALTRARARLAATLDAPRAPRGSDAPEIAEEPL